eukprot:gene1334-775_t
MSGAIQPPLLFSQFVPHPPPSPLRLLTICVVVDLFFLSVCPFKAQLASTYFSFEFHALLLTLNTFCIRRRNPHSLPVAFIVDEEEITYVFLPFLSVSSKIKLALLHIYIYI